MKWWVFVAVVSLIAGCAVLVAFNEMNKRSGKNQRVDETHQLVIKSLGRPLIGALSVHEMKRQSPFSATVESKSDGTNFVKLLLKKRDGGELAIFEVNPNKNLRAVLSSLEVGKEYGFPAALQLLPEAAN